MHEAMLEARIRELQREVDELRREMSRHPFRLSTGGSSLPPGTGIYKVLSILDDKSPGGVGWDYPRFSE